MDQKYLLFSANMNFFEAVRYIFENIAHLTHNIVEKSK